jgi:small subunit ribosomal protein YMR-31
VIGGAPGASLGPVDPNKGEFFDRDELPTRFHRLPWTQTEIDAVETAGASLYN